MDFTKLFVSVDDFCKEFIPKYEKLLLDNRVIKRRRKTSLSYSEMMTILISFQTSNYRTFKHFYKYLRRYHSHDFPKLVKYNRFIELMPRVTMPMFAYLMSNCIGEVTGTNFVDSTTIKVCSNKRINSNRVFSGLAKRGKSTMGWFYGFKLHLIINDSGELLSFRFTAGNVDDRQPVLGMAQDIWGKLYGDKGYISKSLFESLFKKGVTLITNIRNNMKNKVLELGDKILLRKRSLIETVNDQLKNVCQIEHSRHRKPLNFLVHLMAGLIGYAKQEKKPSLNIKSYNSKENTPKLLIA